MTRIVVLLALLGGLSACGDPLRDVDRLSDVQIAEDGSATLAEVPSEAEAPQGGLFSRLLNRQSADPTNAAVEAALAEAGGEAVADPEAAEVTEERADVEAQPRRRRGLAGLFGGNRRAANADPAPETALTEPDAAPDEEAPIVEASAAAVEPAPEAEPRRRGLGLFGRRNPERDTYEGPDAQIVEAGTVMPFGEVARVCDLPNGRRGTQVARLGDYRVYDTIPNATAPRPFYITGFGDDCARTFSAAVMIPSDVETHEFLRYEAMADRPYSEVDNAYEAIKATVCRVGRGRPCGDRLDRLERNMQFLTVYRNFGGDNSVWGEILIYNGRVVAMDVTGG